MLSRLIRRGGSGAGGSDAKPVDAEKHLCPCSAPGRTPTTRSMPESSVFPPFSRSLSLPLLPSPTPLTLSFSIVSLRLSLHSLSLLFLSVSISSQYLSAHLSAAGSHGKQCTARRPRKHPLLLSRRGQRAACRFRNLFPAKAPDASNHPSPPPPPSSSSSSTSSSSSLSLCPSFPPGNEARHRREETCPTFREQQPRRVRPRQLIHLPALAAPSEDPRDGFRRTTSDPFFELELRF